MKGVAVLAAVAAIGVPLAFLVGPWVVSLIFGADYTIGGLDLAIILCGVLAHIGLVVVTQVHVARGRHRDVALSWTAGLLAAGMHVLAGPGRDPLRRGRVRGRQRGGRGGQCPDPGGLAPPSCRGEERGVSAESTEYDERLLPGQRPGRRPSRAALVHPSRAPLHRRRPLPRLRLRHRAPRAAALRARPGGGLRDLRVLGAHRPRERARCHRHHRRRRARRRLLRCADRDPRPRAPRRRGGVGDAPRRGGASCGPAGTPSSSCPTPPVAAGAWPARRGWASPTPPTSTSSRTRSGGSSSPTTASWWSARAPTGSGTCPTAGCRSSLDAARYAVPAFAQFLSGRLVLPAGQRGVVGVRDPPAADA